MGAMSGDDSDRTSARRPVWSKHLPPMRYPNEYLWFVFFSALDVMLTWKILERGGSEVNPIAHLVIRDWGLNGVIAFKFALTLFVILVCEHVGRVRERTARWLARTAVGVSVLPPAYSLGLLAAHLWFGVGGG